MDLKELTSEKLALLLQDQYQSILASNQNIMAINNELNRRVEAQPKETPAKEPT